MNARATIPAPHLQERADWALILCMCLAECDPDDAAQIITAALQDGLTGGPMFTFGDTMAEAENWCATAPDIEVQAYVEAGCKRIAGRALGLTARKRLMVALWNGMSAADRQNFLARVAGVGPA